jgi:SAM-dependent methyltransferase
MWRQFGNREPYFGVLASNEFLTENLSQAQFERFFQSGEAYVDSLMREIKDHTLLHRELDTALDFGCGVGRILIPLSTRFGRVVGLDVSPGMLEEAAGNAERFGRGNIELVLSDDSLFRMTSRFSLVHSYIVLQHIPKRRGQRIIYRLLDLVQPGGVAVLHMPYGSDLSPRQRCANWLGLRVPLASQTISILRGGKFDQPVMQMNVYNPSVVFGALEERGFTEAHVTFTSHGPYRGFTIMAYRSELTP